MTEDDAIVKAAAVAEAEAARRGGQEHPDPDRLLAYQEGALPAADREAVQEHLAHCPPCARVVLDFRTFPEVELIDPELALEEDEVEASWERLREGLPPAAPPATVPAARRRPLFATPQMGWALAAVLLVAAVGLAFWVVELRSELARPRLNLYLADLVPPAASIERTEGGEQLLAVPPEADHLLLLLNLADPRSYPEYEAEILGAGGDRIWHRRGLARSPDGHFTLELPRGFLPEGSYRLRLYGLAGGQREPVVDYDFGIVYE